MTISVYFQIDEKLLRFSMAFRIITKASMAIDGKRFKAVLPSLYYISEQ